MPHTTSKIEGWTLRTRGLSPNSIQVANPLYRVGAEPVQGLLEELRMLRPVKTKTDLFATMEDDIRQFWGALVGVFRAAPGAIA
jgi:hypothetical protein